MDIRTHPCPNRCGSESTQLLSTTNEWQYYCQSCDIRFNADGEIYMAQSDEQDIVHPFRDEVIAEIRKVYGESDGIIMSRDAWDYYASIVTKRHSEAKP